MSNPPVSVNPGFSRNLDKNGQPDGEGCPVDVLVSDIRSVAIECSPNLVDPLNSQVASIGQLVVSIPAPSRDHRKHQDPALTKQVLINTRVVFADILRCMGNVKLDRATTRRLKVYKQQPILRVQQVARMRLAV